jgi:hypothetical protein
MAVVAHTPTPATRRPWALLRWRMALAPVLAAMLLTGAVSAYAASEDAVPGDPNYAVRGAGEQVRLLGATSPVDRERLRAQFAQARLRRLPMLLDSHRSAAAGELLRDARRYLQQAVNGLDELHGEQREQMKAELGQIQALHDEGETQLNQQNGVKPDSGDPDKAPGVAGTPASDRLPQDGGGPMTPPADDPAANPNQPTRR